MTGRLPMLAVTIGVAAALIATIVLEPIPLYIWNASASVPIGLYRLRPADRGQPIRVVAIQRRQLVDTRSRRQRQKLRPRDRAKANLIIRRLAHQAKLRPISARLCGPFLDLHTRSMPPRPHARQPSAQARVSDGTGSTAGTRRLRAARPDGA